MIVVECPAKVNLFLAVGRPDGRGYHPIRTIFQAIGLFDTLALEVGHTEDVLECDWPGLPAENTLTRALRLVRELIPVPPLRMRLVKRIPDQTGLGGGSSDAAGLLRAVAHLTGGDVSPSFLADVAAAVGKDVPFFLIGGRSRGEGYGERLSALPDEDPSWIVVARPELGCSTKDAYARLDALEYPFLEFPEGAELYNDFERVAPCESLEQIERLLAYGAEGALLCGSGSGAFGIFAEEGAARMVARRIAEDSRTSVWVAPTLSRDESLQIKRLPNAD